MPWYILGVKKKRKEAAMSAKNALLWRIMELLEGMQVETLRTVLRIVSEMKL